MITIREATPADIPVLIDFQKKLAIETENMELSSITLEKGMMALFHDPSKGKYFVAEEEGEIAGCHMITFEWSDWRNGMVWWLQSVYVAERFRNKGVFRMMYIHLLKKMESDPGIIGLRLYVEKTNIRAQQVYQAMGMNGEHYTVYEQMKF